MTDSHDLYGLPLERFVPERNALVKALRKDGGREQAQKVSSMRKPSVAAWAVNQLVRTQSGEIAALFEAGDALQHAQSQLLAGQGDGDALRQAVARERDAVSELTALARGLLSSDGHELTQTTLDRVSETLHAAALDEDARAGVKDGCLERELRHIGLGAFDAASPPASRPAEQTKPHAPRRSPDVDRRAETRRTERERAERLKVARKAEADAGRAAKRTQRELETAQARRDDAADSLRRAEDTLAAARDNAKRATLEHQRVGQALDRL